jgi:hypothetical protein
MSTIDVRKAFEDAFADELKGRIGHIFVMLASGQTLEQAEAEFCKGVEEMKQAYDSIEAVLTKMFP